MGQPGEEVSQGSNCGSTLYRDPSRGGGEGGEDVVAGGAGRGSGAGWQASVTAGGAEVRETRDGDSGGVGEGTEEGLVEGGEAELGVRW